MTLKKSWVNKSLIVSDLKRFKWGSIIYLIFLFLSTNLIFITQMPFNRQYEFIEDWFDIMNTFNTSFLIGVTAVVGILTLRRQSNKKQLFFEKALPIKEHTAVLSHIISGFILMIAPILINCIIMVLVMLFDTTNSITFTLIGLYFAKALLSIAVLFAFVCFSNILTGNPFAGLVLNGIVQALPFMFVTTIENFGERFLKGFPNWDSEISEYILKNIPIVKLYSVTENYLAGRSNIIAGIIYLVILSIILYAVSIFLATKRKAEDVDTMICFRHLAPVLKYLLTILIASLEMLTLHSMELGNVFTGVFMVISGAIVFFGIEMLQRKNVHVFKTFPGFVITGVLFCGVIAFMANTSFFGYETRIPKKDDIASASIIDHWADRGAATNDSAYIDFVLESHQKYIRSERTMNDYNSVEIRYILKNGKQMVRKYPVSEEESNRVRQMCKSTKPYYDDYIAHSKGDYAWYFEEDTVPKEVEEETEEPIEDEAEVVVE